MDRFPEALGGIPDAVVIVDTDGGGARVEFRDIGSTKPVDTDPNDDE